MNVSGDKERNLGHYLGDSGRKIRPTSCSTAGTPALPSIHLHPSRIFPICRGAFVMVGHILLTTKGAAGFTATGQACNEGSWKDNDGISEV